MASAPGHATGSGFTGSAFTGSGFDAGRLERLAERLRAVGVERYAVQCVRTARMLDGDLADAPAPHDQQRLWERLGRLFPSFTLRG